MTRMPCVQMNQGLVPMDEPQYQPTGEQEDWEVGLSQVELTPDGNIMPVVRAPTQLPGIDEEDQADPRRWSADDAGQKGHLEGTEVVVDDEDSEEEEYGEPEEYDPEREASGKVKLPPPQGMARFGV